MDITQYQHEAENTKSNTFSFPSMTLPADHRGLDIDPTGIPIDVLHSIVGISTEGGELLDAVKKTMFYGKAIDYVNLDEEMGDILWYIAIYANARGVTIEKLAEMNNRKLKHRYPEKFTADKAENRDLNGERAILEK